MIQSIAADPLALAGRFRRLFIEIRKAVPKERQSAYEQVSEDMECGAIVFSAADLEGTPGEGVYELCMALKSVRELDLWSHALTHVITESSCKDAQQVLLSAVALALHIGYTAAQEQRSEVADLEGWAKKQNLFTPRQECERCSSRQLYPTPGKGDKVDCGKCGHLQSALVMLT